MWIKKTEIEKAEEERLKNISEPKSRFRKSLYLGMFVFILEAILSPLASVTIGIPRGLNYTPKVVLRIDELPEYLPGFLRVALLMGITIFLISYFMLLKIRTSTLMCDKCHKTKNFEKNIKCECGGCFINIENFKWIDD